MSLRLSCSVQGSPATLRMPGELGRNTSMEDDGGLSNGVEDVTGGQLSTPDVAALRRQSSPVVQSPPTLNQSAGYVTTLKLLLDYRTFILV